MLLCAIVVFLNAQSMFTLQKQNTFHSSYYYFFTMHIYLLYYCIIKTRMYVCVRLSITESRNNYTTQIWLTFCLLGRFYCFLRFNMTAVFMSSLIKSLRIFIFFKFYIFYPGNWVWMIITNCIFPNFTISTLYLCS